MSTEKKQPFFQAIKLKDIVADKTQPRKHFDDESVHELSISVREKGVIEPVIVRAKGKGFQLVCGERRYRASLLVQGAIKTRDEIPAMVHDLTDEEALELQITENLQRKDVHPLEEAVAFKALIALNKMELKEVAARVGKSPTYVAQRLKLNDLIDEFQKVFYQGRMTMIDAIKVSKIAESDQKELWAEDFEGEKGKLEINNYQFKKFMNSLNNAPFNIADPALNKQMGACTGCAFNSASNSLLFPEIANNATCLNSKCFQLKSDTSYNVELKKAIEDPAVILVHAGYGSSKISADLEKKGNKVYDSNYSGQFKKEEAPEFPDIDDFKEDSADDYDTEEEMLQAFNKEVEEYNKELKEYTAKIDSGKYLKAYVVDGDGKGTYQIGRLTKDKTIKPTAAGVKTKEEAGALTAEDIKNEIARINDAEKRKKEIDHEKGMVDIFKWFTASGKLSNTSADLVLIEKRAAILALLNQRYTVASEFCKWHKIKHEYSGHNKHIFAFLSKKTEKQLDEMINGIIRAFMLDAFATTGGVGPHNSGNQSCLLELADFYFPEKLKKFNADLATERLRRESRIEDRIKKLQEQLKELQKAAKPGAKSKPAPKKSIKALVEDED